MESFQEITYSTSTLKAIPLTKAIAMLQESMSMVAATSLLKTIQSGIQTTELSSHLNTGVKTRLECKCEETSSKAVILREFLWAAAALPTVACRIPLLKTMISETTHALCGVKIMSARISSIATTMLRSRQPPSA